MALDISSLPVTPSVSYDGKRHVPIAVDPDLVGDTKTAPQIPSDLKIAVRDLQRVCETFNRHLSFSITAKLGQVVVKVIDNDTDKVVREIPPTELQRVYERIREVLGLLFDKSA